MASLIRQMTLQRGSLVCKFTKSRCFSTRPKSASDSKTRPESEKQWLLCASLLVERPAVLTPELTPVQSSMLDFLHQVQAESSFRSDHDLRRQREQEVRERVRRGEEVNVEETRTTEDDEQDWKNELDAFKPAPRQTPFENDLKSHQRALDKPLFLLVKQRIAIDNTFVWNVPSTVWDGQETLRETAERAIKVCNKRHDLQVKVLGNAPFGYYSYKFPANLNLEAIGMKYFIFKGFLEKGHFEAQEEEVRDFMWVLRDKLAENLAKSTANALLEITQDDLP